MPKPMVVTFRVNKSVKANMGDYESSFEEYLREYTYDVSDLANDEEVSAFVNEQTLTVGAEIDAFLEAHYDTVSKNSASNAKGTP